MAPSMYETFYFVVNTASPPLDNVLARYALTMATDRQAIVSAMREEGFKYLPSIGLAPPYEGYEPLKQLDVVVDGKTYDVLAYNPAEARELFAKAGFPEGKDKNKQKPEKPMIEVLIYTDEEPDKLAGIVKQQWEQNLGVNVNFVRKEWHDYLKAKDERGFKGVALEGKALLLADASDLLSFASGQISKKPLWVDHKFDQMLREAGRARSSNMANSKAKFSECEAYLLRAMPVIPLYSRAP